MHLCPVAGKTTVAILLGRMLAQTGQRVLMIDADPQANLTFYLGHEVQQNQPTLLEVLKNRSILKTVFMKSEKTYG